MFGRVALFLSSALTLAFCFPPLLFFFCPCCASALLAMGRYRTGKPLLRDARRIPSSNASVLNPGQGSAFAASCPKCASSGRSSPDPTQQTPSYSAQCALVGHFPREEFGGADNNSSTASSSFQRGIGVQRYIKWQMRYCAKLQWNGRALVKKLTCAFCATNVGGGGRGGVRAM
ncbi:uncharacterized protein Tco025E_02305 [Trypanosoma conorhini]|uniref:Secreted protein n=1 Tax=Trypanosoma conorhini TaxID=83891 RepID=A0A3R7LDN8_9TRYP|nr:uncharacterized protein Tco025E_02305 [Trypanosoma conorhini]RNF25157.1 hypothetical protein Tco025E_02305 [Trypanosoma conorhini]